MTDLVVMGGQAGGFSGGTQVVGRAPAKATSGSLVSGQGKLIGHWTLPVDDVLSTVLGFSKAVASGDAVTFPVGASPDENLGKVSKWQIDNYPVGQLVDAWVVTSDKYGNPSSPTSSNALYLGRNAISTTRKSLVLADGAVFS